MLILPIPSDRFTGSILEIAASAARDLCRGLSLGG
jgi:hypothetical protein